MRGDVGIRTQPTAIDLDTSLRQCEAQTLN